MGRRVHNAFMATASFTTLGCKVNQYETQKILESFEAAGFDVVPFDQPADVVVINTCSVTSDAESKSRYTIRRAGRTNPNAKIVVTGCAAQMALNKSAMLEGAHVVVPNPEKLDTITHFFREFPAYAPQHALPIKQGQRFTTSRSRATLKIQDGCSVMCSYCSIPYTRPGLTSRHFAAVIEEAEHMISLGYREIVLTGVLIGAYGPESGSGGPDFEDLIEQLAQIDGLERMRISSIEMRQVTPRLIALLQAGTVVPHLHIPLQSGDSGVLADMNRPYSQSDYIALCDRLYAQVPDISITADIMVGFPTETDERFESSVRVCEAVRYLKAHVFRFSPRFGTPADAWGDPVLPEVKAARSAKLIETTRRTGLQHTKRFVGRTMRVLAEAKGRDGLLTGLTDNYLEVKFPGPESILRSTVQVRLDELVDGVFRGEVVSQRVARQLRVL